MPKFSRFLTILVAAIAMLAAACAQELPSPLDPTRSVPATAPNHVSLPEQYIWTHDPATLTHAEG